MDCLALTRLDSILVDKARGSREVFDVGLLDIGMVDAVELLHVGVTLVLECEPVEAYFVSALNAVVAHDVRLFEERRHVPHNLLGHATYVDAGAANDFVLNDGDALSKLSGSSSTSKATRASTDHNQVKGRLFSLLGNRDCKIVNFLQYAVGVLASLLNITVCFVNRALSM